MKPLSLTSEQTYAVEVNRKNAIERRKAKLGMTNDIGNAVKEFATPLKQKENSFSAEKNLKICPLTPAQISKIEMNKLAALERRKLIKEREEDDVMLKIANLYEKNHTSSILQFDSHCLPASQDRNSFNMSQYLDEMNVDAHYQLSSDQLLKIEMNKMAALEKRKREKESKKSKKE
jgi:hypothetical protein